MTVGSSTSTAHVDNSLHHHVIHGTTHAQRVFILAVTVAVVAGAIFSLITLGAGQAIIVGGSLGLATIVSLSEFFRVRMIKLSQLSTYKHSEWALFPKGFIANANIMRRPLHKKHKPHVENTLVTSVASNEVPAVPHSHHHSRHTAADLTRTSP